METINYEECSCGCTKICSICSEDIDRDRCEECDTYRCELDFSKGCKYCGEYKCMRCKIKCDKCKERYCECELYKTRCLRCNTGEDHEDRYIRYIWKSKEQEEKIKNISNEIEELKIEIKYRPYGEGYKEAKSDFDNLKGDNYTS